MKKVLAVIMVATLSFGMIGCGIGVGGNDKVEGADTTKGGDVAETNIETIEAKDDSSISNFPEKPIEIIVSFGAGGGADISVRMLSKYAEEHLGQKIIVKNVTGGGGTVGITQLAGAKNDGYTLGYFASTNSNDKLLFEGIDYDIDSFTPIVKFASDPHIIIASTKSGITSMDDLIAKAKADPKGLTFGIGGAWNSTDFLKLKLEEVTETEMTRMVFQGGAAAVNAVASGDCDVAVPFVSEALPQIEAGNIIPIGITSEERFELSPDIETVKESGLDFVHTMWRGLVAPAGVPDDAVKKLSEAFEAAVNDPEYQTAALESGVFLDFENAEDFGVFYQENHEDYKKLIEAADFSE